MKLKILSTENKFVGEIELPQIFNEEFRPDIIKRAVLAIQSHRRQPYGAYPKAGQRQSSETSKRRRDFKANYGKGISRTPKKTMTRRGEQMYWVGATAPMTVGGRRAHPPKAEKIWYQKINEKERKKSIRSALSAAININIIKQRGHIIPESYPFILSDEFEKIRTTKKAVEALKSIGLKKELERASQKKVRAGKGKARGRPYRKKKGPLIVVSKECEAERAFKNIAGIDIIQIKHINTELLAPGTHAGRITLFTKSAIEKIEKERLFT